MTMRRRFEEATEDIDRTGTVGRYDEVVEERRGDPWNIARGWVRMVGAWIMVVLAVVETILIFRLGFQMASANPNNGFVDFIYDVSGGLVGPFEGIARNRSVGDGGVFEPATVIAMAVYLVAAMLLVAMIWALTSAPSPAGERSVTTRSHRGTSVH